MGLALVPVCAEASPPASAPKLPKEIRRFALVVGANDGGVDRTRLRYATSDATALSGVMTDIGGVAKKDRFTLNDPNPTALAGTFATIAQTIATSQKAGQQTQLVFYYSGHSDEQGLLLAGQLMDYKSLRTLIKSVPADVHVAILDSCASGAFTRLKGGTKRPAFMTQATTRVKGYAYLTSSSADESSQESDKVGGSFFTHYFVTGLRGGADRDGDKQVTLNEAYQFAYDETLARTQSTQGGPQHANYDINLAGSGDLVMTDLRVTSAQLEITSEVGGRVFARDSNGYLSAELYKKKNEPAILLALEPDMYEITVADGDDMWKASLTVREGKKAMLTKHGLAVVQAESTVLRGSTEASEPGITLPEQPMGPGGAPVTAAQQMPVGPADAPPEEDADYEHVPFNFGLFPPLNVNSRAGNKKVINNFSIDVFYGHADQIKGAQLGVGVNAAREYMGGLQLALVGNISHRASEGIQGSLFFNWANRHKGMQVGLLNMGQRIHGLQVGLINTADEADASIGLVTYTKKGGVYGNFWTSDTAMLNAAVRFRANYTYTFVAFGGHPLPQGQSLQYGLGFGGHIPIRNSGAYIDIDNAIYAVHTNFSLFNARSPAALDTLRLMVGYRPKKRVAFFAGPTFNLLFDPTTADPKRPGYNYTVMTVTTPSFLLRGWPGFSAGVEF
jgi:hypothetical protein